MSAAPPRPPPAATEVEALARSDLLAQTPDAWLATRLVSDPVRRVRLLGLYLLDLELGRAGRVANPLAGEIRLAWWREEIETTAQRGVASQPCLKALAPISPRLAVTLEGLVEGRHAELEARPFEDEPALMGYLDAVDGSILQAGCEILAEGWGGVLSATGRTLGLSRLLLRRPAGAGFDWRPRTWGPTDGAVDLRRVRERLDALRPAVREEVRSLPSAAFPAAALAAFSDLYAKGRRPGGVEKRARLLWAVLRGVV